jgi:hypothetical protein
MTDRELMQQALDALQEYVGVVVSVNDPNDWTPKVADAGEPARKAIEALRARLAQPEPEPVAWLYDFYGPDDPTEIIKDWTASSLAEVKRCGGVNLRPLYTAPPQREWKGLTEYEVGFLTVFDELYDVEAPLLANFIRHIEAKLKEKNT